MNRRTFVLGAAAVLAAPSAALAARPNINGQVKVGVHLSLSGNAAFAGAPLLKGMQLAADELNASKALGPSAQIVLVTGDDASDKSQGIDVMERLISADNVAIVVGGTLSPVTEAIAPVAQQRHTPFVIANPSAPGLTKDGNFIFRTSQVYTPFFREIVDATVPKYHWKTAAIVYGNDNDATVTMFNDYTKFMEQRGVKFVAQEGITSKDTDFSVQIAKIQAANPDVLLPMLIAPQAAAFILQARRSGINAPLLGQQAHNSPDMYRIAGDAVVGEILPAHWFIGADFPRNRTFIAAYHQKYGSDPDQFAANGYQAMQFAMLGVGAGGNGTNRDAVQRGLSWIKTLDGIFGLDGKMRVDENREVKVKGIILQIGPGGKIQLWKH